MNSRSSIRCVVFDFDGTLIDSNRLKQAAWFEVFRPLGLDDSAIARLLAENPLADRYQLAKLAFEQGVRRGSTAEGIRLLAEHYNAICEDAQATCAEIAGASGILATLAPDHALYLNSATPEEVLCRVVRRRGWQDYFRGIYGRPRGKVEILRMIARGEQLEPQQVAMVGDGLADMQAAQEFGCSLYAVGEMATPAPAYGVGVDSLLHLPSLLAQHSLALPN